MIYGYCRVSTPRQSLERQETNIKAAFPDAIIISEEWTGSTLERPKWGKLRAKIKAGDTVVFDEISRMSRNAAEGIEEYRSLCDAGADLVFLKEPHLNTAVYREQMQQHIPPTGTDIDMVLRSLDEYRMTLVSKQIELAFDQAEKELKLLHQRTSEGLKRAQIEGKQVGRLKGSVIETRKGKTVKRA